MSKAGIISAAERDRKWIDANYEMLTREYYGRCIVVPDRKVMDSDPENIAARLRKRLGGRYLGAAV